MCTHTLFLVGGFLVQGTMPTPIARKVNSDSVSKRRVCERASVVLLQISMTSVHHREPRNPGTP